MKKQMTLLVMAVATTGGATMAQELPANEIPFIETSARADTMIAPDRIYLAIVLAEKDTKGRRSVEELETTMVERLTRLGIDVERQLAVTDLASNFKRYFARQQEVLKEISFSLLVRDAPLAARVIVALEAEGISNVSVERTEYSREKELRLALKRQAVIQARRNAETMIAPLGQQVGRALVISDTRQPLYNTLPARKQLSMYSSRESLDMIDVEFQKLQFHEEVVARFLIH
ncbi:MAG: SIMPL domain-containing protein [Odoribacteraceae bacterium]|nr:SIMPL domain-containing protein [Odoribacteraceae bacterium]